jgi:hypothetical protein
VCGLLESAENVGDRPGWGLDSGRPELVEQSQQLVVLGQLGLAPEALPHVLDDNFVGDKTSVEDRGKGERDLATGDLTGLGS